MRKLIQRFFNQLGYEVRRQPDLRRNLPLYAALYPRESLQEKQFYNIGAGGFRHPYWTNVDYDSNWYADNRAHTLAGIQFDLLACEPLPLESETAQVVYSSHTIEHISDESARNVFSEAQRILRPGGYLRITAPNVDLDYRAYRDDDRNYFYWIDMYSEEEHWRRARYTGPLNRASTAQIFLSHFAASVSTLHADGMPERIEDDELRTLFTDLGYEGALNHCVSRCGLDVQRKYPGNHMNWWNPRKLIAMLEEAGFTAVYLSGYGQSHCPVLRDTSLFDNTHPRMSLYVEASK